MDSQFGLMNVWAQGDIVTHGVALLLVGNHLLGFLVLQALSEPFNITFEDLDLLKTVGRNVAVQFAQWRADE